MCKLRQKLNGSNKEAFVSDLSKEFNENVHILKISNKNKELPNQFIYQIFNNEINDPVYSYKDKKLYIGKTKSLEISDGSENLQNNQIRINNSIGNELINELIDTLSKDTKIKINEDLFNSITSNII